MRARRCLATTATGCSFPRCYPALCPSSRLIILHHLCLYHTTHHLPSPLPRFIGATTSPLLDNTQDHYCSSVDVPCDHLLSLPFKGASQGVAVLPLSVIVQLVQQPCLTETLLLLPLDLDRITSLHHPLVPPSLTHLEQA